MGKTDSNAGGVIFLLDKPEDIMRKFARAVTDSGNEVRAGADKPGITNLLNIWSVMTGKSVAEGEKEFAGANYETFKRSVGEAVVEHLRPVREKYSEYIRDKGELERIMREGADKAARIARRTLSKVYRKVGFVTL